jgi:pyruvate carboxylase
MLDGLRRCASVISALLLLSGICRQPPAAENGDPEVAGRARPARLAIPHLPAGPLPPAAPGTKQKLNELRPEAFARWMLDEPRVLITDTTLRDAHQSLLTPGYAPST